MAKTLYYLFDPLCGWCYGAGPGLVRVREASGASVILMPTGLFSGSGARPMDDDFAAYAWANDQRIERLTGQRFTERYRTEVLGNRQRFFDSGPATVALTAVALTAPAKELDILKAIQQMRYIEGGDVTSLEALAELLRSLKLPIAAKRIATPDTALLDAVRERTARSQKLMQEVGARGVPTLVVEADGHRQVLQAAAIYTNPQALVTQLAS